MILFRIDNWISRAILMGLLVLSYLIFSYNYFNGWWYSSFGTIFILLFSFLIWKHKILEVTGLKIPRNSLGYIFLVILLTIGISYLLITRVSARNGIEFEPKNVFSYFHIIFYTLNEEIILGGLLIFFYYKHLKLNPFLVSFGLALIFAIIHYVFYRWIVLYPDILTFPTLASLFFVGVLRNNLIINNNHIGYAWALHFGWMVIMFGNYHFFPENENGLLEPEIFNFFLGSWEMLIISLSLALISTIAVANRNKKLV